MNKPKLDINWENIDLTSIIEGERIESAVRLKERIEGLQDKVVHEMVNKGYKLAGSYKRKLVTSLGITELKIIKLKRGNRITSPILDRLGIRREKYSREVKMKLADMASVASYGESSRMFKNISGIDLPKSTIHGFVQEVGSLIEFNGKVAKNSVVEPDGTEAHSTGQKNSSIKVAISYGQEGHQKSLISVTVNKGWASMPQGTFTVSDAEREIENNVDPSAHQLDLVHAVRDTLYMMWMDSAPKEERDQISGRMKEMFHTLVNSVRKHLADKDMDVLSSRIDRTLDELEMTARELERSGYQRAARFIRAHSRFMVTFARVAISEGKRIPYTSNAIERLMAEIMRRCKHIWARWSDKGLENILKIRLFRIVEPDNYMKFWQSYIHPVVKR